MIISDLRETRRILPRKATQLDQHISAREREKKRKCRLTLFYELHLLRHFSRYCNRRPRFVIDVPRFVIDEVTLSLVWPFFCIFIRFF